MTKVILVRHGETDWNKEKIFRGRANIGLNETGVRQAEATGRALAQLPLSAVYSSPLIRSLETAKIIANYQRLEPIALDGLIDMDYREWQGLSPQGVKNRFPNLYREWEEHPTA